MTAAAKNALHVKGDDEDMIGAWFKGGLFYARVASTAGKGVKCDYDIVIGMTNYAGDCTAYIYEIEMT